MKISDAIKQLQTIQANLGIDAEIKAHNANGTLISPTIEVYRLSELPDIGDCQEIKDETPVVYIQLD